MSVDNRIQNAVNAVQEYLHDNDVIIYNDTVNIAEITKNVYNTDGKNLGSEIEECIFSFKTANEIMTRDLDGKNDILNIRYNTKKSTIELMD